MGAALAEAAAARGAEVTLVAGPDTPAVPGARRIDFETAAELERALVGSRAARRRRRDGRGGRRLPAACAGGRQAVAPHAQARRCRSRSRRCPDLLAGLARARRGARPYLVGFAAETAAGDALVERAGAKLREKRCDAIVANDVSAAGIGFGSDDNEVTLLFGDGERHALARAPKRAIADRLWDLLAGRLPAAGGVPCLIRGSRPTRPRRCATWRRRATCSRIGRRRPPAGSGNVPAWPGSDDVDFHGTLSAIWIWARHQRLSGASRYQAPRVAAWGFVETNAKRFIPDAIDNAAGDETAYDCALVLLAGAAERGADGRRREAAGGRRSRGARARQSSGRAGEPRPGASSAIPGSSRSRSPNTRAPSTIGACWRARASSSTARSG